MKLSKKIIFFGILTFSQIVFAAPPTTIREIGSIQPGVLGKILGSEQPKPQMQNREPLPSAPVQQESALGPDAALIKFKLAKVILEGNHVFTQQELQPLYENKLNTTISIADLEKIVNSITSYYRNKGYILTRAVLPPQKVNHGIVRIRVIEGYIANVKVQGHPKKAKKLLLGYGDHIVEQRPTELENMELYLRLANEIPGMTAKAVLEPSKTNVGASDMVIVAEEQSLSGYLSYDNYGTRYIGPNQVTASAALNSVLLPGDSTRLTTVRTTRPQELNYIDFSEDIAIGTKGMRFLFDANNSKTQPGLNLQQLETQGDAASFTGTLRYPLSRARDHDASLDGGFNYTDSNVTVFDQILYNDHIRSFQFGGYYNFADRFRGSNVSSAHIEQGVPLFGASHDPNSLTVSRFGADSIYTKLTANAGRSQPLFWRLSGFIYGTGQYSFNPLLASEQFPFGGSQLGRGYDPAEIIGDRGVGGTVELRMDTPVGLRMLQGLQSYVFYDGGVIWNIKNLPNVSQKQSITSTGVGVRLYFMQNLYGNLMFAQPLTKQVTAEEVVGKGRLPRGFFSITATL